MGFGPVLIIGAGSTGLAIAQGLRKLNIAFHIFETKDELASNPDDWSANISRSFPKLEQLLPQGAVDQLKTSTAVRASPYCGNQSNSGIRVFDGSSAELIRDNEVDKESLTSSKSKLKALCQEGIDVKYRHILHTIEYTDDGNVYAIFTNGERYWGSLVVGADGSSSFVREILYGADKARPKFAEAAYVNIIMTYPPHIANAIRSLNSISSVGVVQDCVMSVSILDMPNADEAKTWRFQVFLCWRKGKESKKAAPYQTNHHVVKSKADLFNEPFRSAILCIPDNLEIQIQDVSSWTPTPWHTRGGRTTLAGSAAHSMPPNSGLGLDNALSDAHKFVNIIKKIVIGDSIKAHAIPAYGHEIVARAVEQAQFNDDVLHSVLESAVLSKSMMNKYRLSSALKGWNNVDTLSESSTNRSESGRSSSTRSSTPSKGRKALSKTRTWFKNQIDNLDVGAEQGTAQTTWVGTGQKAYGRRYFPD